MNYLKEYLKQLFSFSSKALIVAILVLATLMLATSFFINRSYDRAEQQTFSIDGKAERDVTPDVAKISIGTVLTGKNPVALQSDANDSIADAIEAIKAVGIADEKIRTDNYTVQPQYDYEKDVIKSYRVVVNLYVEIDDIDTDREIVGKVLTAASDSGLNNVNSLNYEVSARDDILEELKLEAIEDAKSQKDSLADASGLKLGDLVNVVDSYSPYYYDDVYLSRAESSFADGFAADTDAPSSANIAVQPGQSTLTVNVTLIYEIR